MTASSMKSVVHSDTTPSRSYFARSTNTRGARLAAMCLSSALRVSVTLTECEYVSSISTYVAAIVRRTISATYDRPDPARPYTTAIRADAHARTALSMDPTLNSAVPPPHLLVLALALALVLVLALVVPAAFAPTGVASSHATHKSLNSTIGSIFFRFFFFRFFRVSFFFHFFRFRFFFVFRFFCRRGGFPEKKKEFVGFVKQKETKRRPKKDRKRDPKRRPKKKTKAKKK